MKQLIEYAAGKESRLHMVNAHKQLPALTAAFRDKEIQDHPFLKRQAMSIEHAVPLPVMPHMNAILGAIKPVRRVR